MSPFFNPGPIENPNIPIYIAGVNPGLAGLAGELCDGFIAHPFHSPRYLREVMLPAISAGAAQAGRKVDDVSISVNAFVATTMQERESARSQLAFYASTPSYRPVMALHGWAVVAEQLSSHAAKGEWERMPALISDDMLAEFCLVIDETDLPQALGERYGGLATRLSLYEPFLPGQKDDVWRNLTSAFANV